MKRFYLLLMAAAALVSCSKDDPAPDGNQEGDGNDTPVVTFGTCDPVDPDGGTVTVSFSISDPVEDGLSQASAKSSETWAHDFTVAEGTLTFVVDKYPATESEQQDRTATVTFMYPEAEDATFTVTQIAPDPLSPVEPSDDTFTDTRDGKVYKITKIGSQTWMAENLAWLPQVNKPEAAGQRDDLQYYFVLNYDGEDVSAAKATEEYQMYGVLYNWYAAMGQDSAEGISESLEVSTVQGPCPDGWHLPAKAEWQVLLDYVASELEPVQGDGWYNEIDMKWEYTDGLKNVWSALAGLEGWSESSMISENPDLEAGPRDTYGFNAVPSGMCWQTGAFGQNKTDVAFWMPHYQSYGGAAITFSNNDYMPECSKSGLSQYRGYSVRCIQD